jgi:hypothetical protein
MPRVTRGELRALRAAAFGAWLASSAALGCSPPSRAFPPRPSLLDTEQPVDGAPSPAEWRYHPRKTGKLSRAYELEGGGTLWVGALGERWHVEPGAERAEPASSLAPEALIGALHGTDGRWTFVGESGATYLADGPLGALSLGTAPLERLARVDAGSQQIVAVSRLSALWSSGDAGRSWQRVGPVGVRFSDVLAAGAGAMALQVPERVWWSADALGGWQPLDQAPFGAEALVRDESGPVVVAALGSRRLLVDGATGPRLEPLNRFVRQEAAELSVPPREGPSARALQLGRAFVNDSVYLELELGVKAGSLSGRFGDRLSSSSHPELSACHDAVVSGFEQWVVVACSRERGSGPRRFDFFRSRDGGRSFEREPYWGRGNAEEIELAVGSEGRLLVTGLCSPNENLAGCRTHGIQMREERGADAGAVTLSSVSAPALEGNAHALGFSHDGRIAYAVARRTKSDLLFSFVATDLDAGFRAYPISGLGPAGESSPHQVQALTAARGGQVSLVVGQHSGPNQLVLLSAEGRPISVNAGPMPTAALGAYGARALAVSRDEAWESFDAGASWESVGRLPQSPCASSAPRCSIPVRCQDRGCAVGDSLSRLGWRGQAEMGRALVPPPAPPPPPPRRAVGTAFSCDLGGTEWKELPGVDRLPDVAQAAIGKAAWYALSSDDATAAAGLWIVDRTASAQSSPKVRYQELLAPRERAPDLAYQALLQVEGAAALRYEVPGTPGASPTHLTKIEVVWSNLQEGRYEHGRIGDAGTLLPGDFSKSDGAARRAQADLLSIASGGIFVRVHRQPQHQQTSYYLDGKSVEEIPPLVLPSALPKGTSSEMVRLGRESVALFFVNDGATVLRARRHEQRWQFDAMTLGYAHADSFVLRQSRDIAYLNGRVGIHLTTLRPGAPTEGLLFPVQPEGVVFGNALRVPTQADLQGELPRCSAEQRENSPRLVAPFEPGARRPVLIHDRVEPLRTLLTDSAIVHGTADKPCVEAFDAEPIKTSPSPVRERALLGFDAGPSWLFRVASDNARRSFRIEYRTMTCRLDPHADVPAEVFEAAGTHLGG